jgi:anti-sigma factor RsiW
MNCRDLEARIALYAEGDLVEREALEVEAHLASCGACREFLIALQDSQAGLSRLRTEDPDAAALDRVRRGVVAQLTAEARPRRVAWFWPAWAAGGALAAALVFGVVLRSPKPAPRPMVAARRVAPPVPLASVQSSPRPERRVRRARRVPQPSREPEEVGRTPSVPEPTLLVKLETPDPNVVIYWIVENKGD